MSLSLNQKITALGLSLIEIITILGILMIIGLTSFPLLQQYQPTLKLKGEAKGLAANLRYAQQLAVTEQIIHLIRFLPAAEKYRVIRAKPGEDEEILKEVILKSPITFEEITFTDNEVSFNATGIPSEAGEIILTNQEKNITVEIKPSGYIKIIY